MEGFDVKGIGELVREEGGESAAQRPTTDERSGKQVRADFGNWGARLMICNGAGWDDLGRLLRAS